MERKCKSLSTLTHPIKCSFTHAEKTNVELIKPILKFLIVLELLFLLMPNLLQEIIRRVHHKVCLCMSFCVPSSYLSFHCP